MSASHALSVFAALALGFSPLLPTASTATRSADPVEILPLTTMAALPTSVATAALEEIPLGSGQGLHSFPAWKVTSRSSNGGQPLEPTEDAAILTHPLEVSPFMVLGLTWDAKTSLSPETQLWVRVRETDQWSDWFLVHAEEKSSRDGTGFQGATEPFVTGGADAIQVRVTGDESSLPANLQVALIPTNPSGEEVTLTEDDVTAISAENTGIDAGSEHALTHLNERDNSPHPLLNRYSPTTQPPNHDDTPVDGGTPTEANSDTSVSPIEAPQSENASTRPLADTPAPINSKTAGLTPSGSGTGGGMSGTQNAAITRLLLPSTTNVSDLPVPVSSRQDWKADENKRDWDPEYHRASHVLVHHTVGTNNYSMSQSADIVRGIYHYHAVTLQWGDIGYHFLVDKWGRAFEGRYGTLASRSGNMVIGAHSAGFNSGTMGISMMGNYSIESPSEATIATVAKLAAWQLKRVGVDPEETAPFTTKGGNSKFRKGQTIQLPRISGHRDTFATACPGEGGYKALPLIRSLAHKEIYSTTAPSASDLQHHDPGTSPRGNFEEVISNSATQTLTIKGWTFDQDTPTPISIHATINGTPHTVTANTSRPDVQRAFALNRNTTGFALTLPAQPGTHTICVTALNQGAGHNTPLGCRTTTLAPKTVQPTSPRGNFEEVISNSATQTLTIKGWTFDQDTPTPISIHATINGTPHTVTANTSRPDVQRAFALNRNTTGFALTLPAQPGTHTICVTALNQGAGHNTPLGCRTTTLAPKTVQPTSPRGNFEEVISNSATQTLTIKGWTFDQDTPTPISIHATINGTPHTVTANTSRPDVQRAFALNRNTTGFALTLPAQPGTHTICVTALNQGAGHNTPLGCRTTTLAPKTVQPTSPRGNFEEVISNSATQTLTIKGWTFDQDTPTPISIHATINGTPHTVTANTSRPDVQRAFALNRNTTGFALTLPAQPGTHTICVTALNQGAGHNTPLGCRTTTLAPKTVQPTSPRGNFEEVISNSATQTLTIKGWTFDQDTPTPISIHATINGTPHTVTANTSRPDVQRAFALNRNTTGFALTLPAQPGTHTICVTALNQGAGHNTPLGCRTTTLAPKTVQPTSPRGNFEEVISNSATQTLTIKGWTFDQDTPTPISIHATINGTPHTVTANTSRPDVQRAFALNRNTTGFALTLPAQPGTHTICVTALNQGAGHNTPLGCRTTTLGGGHRSGFNPAFIISDEQLFSPNTMNAASIQSFLNDKGRSCRARSNGVPCLKHYTERTLPMTLPYCAAFRAGNSDSAAQIIDKASKACGINPQVLLVMLQKEQGLVTASGSTLTQSRYERAMGLSCPDSGTCDPSKAGFAKQVYGAAARLVKYTKEPHRYNFAVGRTSRIQFHPSASCGASSITPQNSATAALYNYTPYQPNTAALDNMNGVGDSCSSYGNRNLWRLMKAWF